MGLLGEEISYKRQKMTWNEKLLYQFPPRLAKNADLSDTVKSRLRNNQFVLVAKFENDETAFTFIVPYQTTPHKLLDIILAKKNLNLKRKDRASDYILKISGQDEYLFGEFPLVQFLYIQDTLFRDGVPTVVIQGVHNVRVFEDSIYQVPEDDERKHKSSSTTTLRKKVKHISSWNVAEQFEITLHSIKKLNCDTSRTVEVGIQVGLFHGGKSLCEPQKSSEKFPENGDVDFEETITFDINVHNVPRMARLCLVVYETARSAKGGGVRVRRVKDSNKELYINPLAWVNTTVFDYKNQLKSGAMTLYTWTYAEDTNSEDLLHPLGTVESNPRNDGCAAIMLSFSR